MGKRHTGATGKSPLKIVLLDVVPELLGHCAAGQRLCADDHTEHGIRLDGLHQRRVQLPFDLFGRSFLGRSLFYGSLLCGFRDDLFDGCLCRFLDWFLGGFLFGCHSSLTLWQVHAVSATRFH